MTYENGMKTQRLNPEALKGSKERDYWLQKLSGLPGKTTFPYEPGKTGKTRDMHTLSAQLTGPIYSTMAKISNNSDVRLHIILVAGWLMLLNKYTGSSDIIVGIPIYKQKTGNRLINTVLALRNKVNGEMTVKELLLQVGENVLEANHNQNYPINTLLYKLKVPESGGDFPLFDISILLEEIHHGSYLEGIRQNMIVSFNKTPSALQCVVEYNRQVYSETFMNRIIVHFRQLLHNALADVNTPIGQVDILSEQERKQLLKDFNDNAADFPRDKTVPQLIAEQAEKNPENTALTGPKLHNPDEKHISITYGELHKKTDGLACRLKEKGVTLETVAAVMMERSIEMTECILAIWKAGGAYLPIDPFYPQDRIDYILENSGAVILLTTSDFSNKAKCEIVRFSDAINRVPTPPSFSTSTSASTCQVGSANLAYIIYTSGSTGQPKGAMVEHIGMMNHIYAKIDTLNITGNSIIAQNASHTFDISVWQFFTALTRGGKTVIYPDALIMDPRELIARISDDRVTILEMVPSYLSVLLAAIPARQDIPFSLEYLLVTGEEIKPQLVNRWFARFPAVKMVNAYGPTEASDDITHHVMDRPPDAGSQRVPIGKPIQNLNIYIVDEHMKLCPIGIKGEICVSGVGVGRGYIKDEKKTRRIFMEDPFVEEKGVRLYKTGDIGCWLPDGIIDYFGRKDHQVKIRGFRIELGEIENQLLSHPQVKEAVVLDREDAKDNKFLCAYIVDTGVTGTQLKEYLSRALPDHMVPAHFLKLERIPLTPNGKINRNALLEMKVGSSTGENSRIVYINEEMLNRLAAALEVEKSAVESCSLEEIEIDSGRQEETAAEAERQQILYRFNNTETGFPHDKTLYQLLEEKVGKKPDKIAAAGESVDAALDPDVKKNEIYDLSLSYKELNRRANQLARRLQASGIKRNSIVGIMMEPSPELLIALLAIMKAGAAYLAMEVSYPDKRIDYLCKDSGMELIVIGKNRELPDKAAMAVKAIDKKLYRGKADKLPLANTSRDPAALFYTSGSTGKPKGVIDEHQGLVNRIWWMQQFYPLDENDVILQKTPIIFDVSVEELFGWCPVGASLYFISPTKGNKPGDVIDAVVKGNVTHIHIPPAFQLPFLHYLESSGRVQEMRRLKRVYASGEALLPTHVNEFNRLLYRSHGTRLINLYGPTEASIEVSYFDCSSDQPVAKVPIGKPIHNLRLYIVNKNLELAPVGVPGELCIAGVGLARGYLNQPELTAEKFCLDLYRSDKSYRTYIYRTGDLARWLPDGNIEFLGRFDHQVQLGGIRIELGEIESELLKHRDIKEAAVVSWKDEKDKHSLCAFVKSANHRDLGRSDFKTVLAGELPHFMIPNRFVEIDRIPLTSSGKIDRKTLRELAPFSRRETKNNIDDLLKQAARSKEKGKDIIPQHTEEESMPKEIVLPEQEKHKILHIFNDTEAEYPRDKTIHRLFEEQTEKKPDNAAVTGRRQANDEITVTYLELNKKSNRLARELRAKGIGTDTIIGIMVDRTLEMIIGTMAVLKAGGAYLAIALTYPGKRIDFMCRDSRMPLLLTDGTRPLQLTGEPPLTMNIDSEENRRQDTSNLPMPYKSRDAAAVFYTSGSTGTPKGTILEHRGLVNRMHWMHRRYPIAETDVILQKTAVIFDVSVWELFWWSFYGASVYLMTPGKGDHPQDIVEAVSKGNVTQMHFIPTPMVTFLDYLETAGGDKSINALASLKRVFASGEALPALLVNRFNRLLYRTNGTRLYNLYGPTEASIDVSYFDCPPDDTLEKIPIGKPIDNIRLYIVNRALELLPIGVPGELCIAGTGLARGYLNQPGLTAERFCIDLYRSYKSYRTYIYRTGDLARWLPDGNIEFLGRIDQQVQISGIRIELGEIESALLKHKDIKEAVVIPRNNEKNEPYLCAFVKAAGDLGQSNFKESLVKELPLYMIPAGFVELEKIPLTPTGKVNRKLLASIAIEDKKQAVESKYAAPKSEIEIKIAAIWKEVLNTTKIGIHDNFFDIGGNSLGIIQVIFKLKESLKRDIPALIMFEYPTIASIIQYLEKNPEDSTVPGGDDEEKDRREKTGRGQNKMRQRRGKLKQIRIE